MLLQPCFVFIGEGFDNNPELRMAKSLLLDFFRGRQIDAINLKVGSVLALALGLLCPISCCVSAQATQEPADCGCEAAVPAMANYASCPAEGVTVCSYWLAALNMACSTKCVGHLSLVWTLPIGVGKRRG